MSEPDGREPIAVILAGGRGQRLAPLTDTVPKPLLTIGRTTILERLVEGLAAAGIVNVWLAVNYKAEAIEERLGDGSAYGVRIDYLRERSALGTAGPLSLLPRGQTGPVLVMNADQVTALDFARLVDFHAEANVAITVASFVHQVHIPYGVLQVNGGDLSSIAEKPTMDYPCNAGIYVLDPDLIDMVPENTEFPMTKLIEAVLAEGRRIAVFPITERFIDIGTREELDEALVLFATGEEV